MEYVRVRWRPLESGGVCCYQVESVGARWRVLVSGGIWWCSVVSGLWYRSQLGRTLQDLVCSGVEQQELKVRMLYTHISFLDFAE